MLGFPNRRDVQQNLRLESALLGLMGLEHEHRRRSQGLSLGWISEGLRVNARLQRHAMGGIVIGVIRIVIGMGHHELRLISRYSFTMAWMVSSGARIG